MKNVKCFVLALPGLLIAIAAGAQCAGWYSFSCGGGSASNGSSWSSCTCPPGQLANIMSASSGLCCSSPGANVNCNSSCVSVGISAGNLGSQVTVWCVGPTYWLHTPTGSSCPVGSWYLRLVVLANTSAFCKSLRFCYVRIIRIYGVGCRLIFN
jgi:hypothetical protein